MIRSPALEYLHLSHVTLPGWPATGVLSSNYGDNCLDRVRAHLDDLAEGAVQDPRIKLLILGNGGAGKTQIANWLSHAEYRLNPNWDSTHGIQVSSAALTGDPPLTLSIWDFGGQDLYHGVHALFLNSPALLLLVWATDTEDRGGHGDGELWFRDHPLPYWLALARHQAHAYSPVILAQSKCDRVEDRVRPFPVEAAALDALPYPAPQLYLSVGAGTGRDGLVEEIRIAANWLRDPTRMGVPRVGKGRVAVRDRMEEMRGAGTRLLSMADFRALCAEIGGVSAPEHLLTWLDAEGVVFHRPGLFQDQVVLDPSWALDAIYTIFDRQSGMAKRIQRQRGRFTRDLLSDTLWRDYSVQEQKVFLSMMVSCGICFVLREWREDGEWLREYVAPDLLPERDAVVGLVPVRWSDSAPTQQAVYTFPMLHGGLIRTILSRIGSMAGEDALYWRGGLCGYETRYRSRFLIEQEMTGDWSGHITVRTQDGDALGLLSRLQEIVERAAALVGLRGERAAEEKPRRVMEMAEAETPPALRTGPDPVPVREWYVSYAWKDAANPDLEQPVDELCAEAAKRGIRIKRDRTDLGPGDGRISAFMDKIGAGERIVVVLSKKYLESPFCMHELHAIWRRSRTDDEFINRVRLWAPGTVPIWNPKQRVGWNQHWFKEFNDLNDCLEPGQSPTLLGLDAYQRLLLMREFYAHAADILGTLADHVHKREWPDFLDYVFQDVD
ncbi:COR domain-containing protein [Niveispirillum cyanobacteriorum]|uniref:COR domain-containing protein n=1 Tax=Niveispirillum cyanobacteriorum TaxID=1612173 RepID=UPI001319F663|nr:COR domain-containing protein [Niveispirillum cyanobacteriorum]